MSAEDQGVGTIEPVVAAEFPGLTLLWQTVTAAPGRSPAALRGRLEALSERYTGARVVAMRTQALAQAYRTFFRQIGLDPDITRVPSESTAVRRLREGGLRSRERIADALTVAVAETGVPVWALDADSADAGTLGIRTARAGDALPGEALAAGDLLVADARAPLARVFGEVGPAHRPCASTERVALFTIGVDGVPLIYLDEALWLCTQALESG